MVRYCGQRCRTKICCGAFSWVMALYVSGTLFGSCGEGDERGEAFSLSSLDR